MSSDIEKQAYEAIEKNLDTLMQYIIGTITTAVASEIAAIPPPAGEVVGVITAAAGYGVKAYVESVIERFKQNLNQIAKFCPPELVAFEMAAIADNSKEIWKDWVKDDIVCLANSLDMGLACDAVGLESTSHRTAYAIYNTLSKVGFPETLCLFAGAITASKTDSKHHYEVLRAGAAKHMGVKDREIAPSNGNGLWKDFSDLYALNKIDFAQVDAIRQGKKLLYKETIAAQPKPTNTDPYADIRSQLPVDFDSWEQSSKDVYAQAIRENNAKGVKLSPDDVSKNMAGAAAYQVKAGAFAHNFKVAASNRNTTGDSVFDYWYRKGFILTYGFTHKDK